MGLELRVVISANINSTIAVILSPNLSLYDLQKPRYDLSIFALTRATLHVRSAQTPKIRILTISRSSCTPLN